MAIVFDHKTLPQRVLFGTYRARQNVSEFVAETGATRIMVLASEREAERAASVTADTRVTLNWTEIAQHVPLAIAERARAAAVHNDIDLLICVGGGSTTGMAKAIAMTTGIPILAVPTTYAGSEATNVWGLTESQRKTTGTDDRVLPAAVVYDASLTLSLPVGLSVASGLNGIAHCIDSLWAPRADPINAALAAEGIRALAAGLRLISANPVSPDGREQALYGAYLAAVAFASAGSGMHHKICHALGGTYNLPHAQTHAIVLPYVTAFNAASAPDAEARIAQAFQSETAVAGLLDLRTELDAPKALRDYGFDEASIPEAARIILPSIPESNPRAVSIEDLETLLRAAWAGTTPDTDLLGKETHV
jgi:maleylacetate reductase